MADKIEFGMSEDNQKAVLAAVENAVACGGVYELVELKYSKEFGQLNITAYIWKQDGITLDDCENVHNNVSAVLDKFEDAFPSEYVLNVSSQGLDRKIVSDDDFRRAMDTDIEVINKDKTKVHGVLKSCNENEFVIESGGKTAKEMTINRADTTKVQPYIKFS